MSGLLVKSTVVMKENLEEMNPARPRDALAGDPRRCCADPGLRRAGPRRALRRRGPLRTRRVRGAAAHGRPGRARPRATGGRRCRRCASAGCAAHAPRQTEPEDMPARSDVAIDNAVPAPPFWGDRVVKGIALADYAAFLDERATVPRPVGAEAVAAAEGGAERTRSSSRPRAGRGCATGSTASRPRGCSRPRSSTATSRAGARATTSSCCTTTASPSGPLHVPAAAPRPAPVPGRLLPPAGVRRDRRGGLPARHRWARGSPRRPPSCSPTTPTATTSSCTACRCS